MSFTRWNDDRLDGFVADYKVLEQQVDHVDRIARDNQRDIADLKASRNYKMQWLMLLATWASPVATVVIVLLTKH